MGGASGDDAAPGDVDAPEGYRGNGVTGAGHHPDTVPDAPPTAPGVSGTAPPGPLINFRQEDGEDIFEIDLGEGAP